MSCQSGRKMRKTKAVYSINNAGEIEKYERLTDVGGYGYNVGLVWKCCNRGGKHKGLLWGYNPDELRWIDTRTVRQHAIAAGHKIYFGTVCVNGHLDGRYTKTGKCVGCAKACAVKQRLRVSAH